LEHLQGGRERGAARPDREQIPFDPKFDVAPLRRLLVQTVQAFTKQAAFQTSKDGDSHRILVEAKDVVASQLEMESALTTVFNAAAKLRGGDLRVIYRGQPVGAVPLSPEPEAELQPDTAAGRYAKETL
jgi:hypothetical protein